MDLTRDPFLRSDPALTMDPNKQNQGSHKCDLSMFVVDILRYDIEPIESILNLLNDQGCIGWRHLWPTDFTMQDVVPALKDLVRLQHVDVYEKTADESQLVPVAFAEIDVDAKVNVYWFLLTDTGREMWENWKPENDAE